MLTPRTPEELAEALGTAAAHRRTITLGGHFSKCRMAGPAPDSEVTIATTGLTRVLQYEPRDLTVSVEAGLPWRELDRMLSRERQMIPLDPPFAESATVGGVIAANTSGPRRRLFGTARDQVIGMKVATLEGKLVQSGGMVVKNVAGLDMAKLMIGSFGTLAGIAVVNFKLSPRPAAGRSFVLAFETLEDAVAARNQVALKSALQPAALDLLSPAAAVRLGRQAWLLAIQVGGNAAVVERSERELAQLGEGRAFDGDAERELWRAIAEFTPAFLDAHPDGAVARVSCTLRELPEVLRTAGAPAVARAGSGVCYAHFEHVDAAAQWVAKAVARGWKAVIDFAPEAHKNRIDLWPSPGNDFEIMKRIKQMFDPHQLLNRGRLYGRI